MSSMTLFLSEYFWNSNPCLFNIFIQTKTKELLTAPWKRILLIKAFTVVTKSLNNVVALHILIISAAIVE